MNAPHKDAVKTITPPDGLIVPFLIELKGKVNKVYPAQKWDNNTSSFQPVAGYSDITLRTYEGDVKIQMTNAAANDLNKNIEHKFICELKAGADKKYNKLQFYVNFKSFVTN